MDGQNYVNEIAFSQPVINIGADSGNDIILRGQGIADFHLMLNYSSNVWHAIPLDPSYTTLVNGRGIGPEGCPVQNGAVLSIGDYRLTLSLNGTYADILVNQVVSSVPSQSASVVTEESEGSSILLALSDKLVPNEIDPGASVEYELTVTNAGPLVANMQLQLQGIPSAWVQIIPPVLNLNEGRSGNFTVRISPPRTSAAKAGLYQLHFVALSPNYPRETGVADAMLTILPYNDFLVNGPTPRRLNLSRSHPSDFSDLNIINNSNAAATFVVRSFDDANELNFAYRQDAGNLTQGQISVTVGAGDNDRVPIQVETRKRPLIGLSSHMHHYYTSVTPTDRPGDAQTLLGEVNVRPLIHIIWLLIIILALAIAALFIFQPRIHQFDSIAGKRTEMILAGNSVGIKWDVSRFASKITLVTGEEERQVPRQGNEFVSPAVSTTYTLKAENFISNLTAKLFGSSAPEKEFRVLLIPRRPSIDVFKTDATRTNYSNPVRLDWAVSFNADTAALTTNKQEQTLAAENYSGSQTNTYTSDALISLKASNASGYEEKSAFVNVKPDKINLNKFIAWVRPNGIAVPSDNDIRRTTRWGSLQLYSEPTASPQTIRQAVNPQPDAQSNVISIPDDFASAGFQQGGISPEQQSVNRILSGSDSNGLLIGSYMEALPTATPVPVAQAVPTAAAAVRSPIVASSSSSPSVSPESRSSATREFSIKLVEVIEDPLEDSGYRVIQYFPDYVLQKSEQILIEWDVDGITTVSIENLSSGGLTAAGTEFAYPEKSTNYVLNAEIGDIKKAYSLPVNVAGDTGEDKGSGENCNLKASATTLAAPGTVMLTWTGGGNDRVQLVSSVKAEEESNEAEKKKEAEAKEKGEKYTKSENIEMSGGIIGDYLQPSGFMRVNVDKQTTFVLNAFDGEGNVICSKEAEIKYTGGNDKLDLKLEITKITDTNDVEQPYYTVGQTVQFTIALKEFKKGLDPTGSIMLTDGDSSCTMTLPKDTCSMVMKHEGLRTITAVYSGDDAYNKATATGSLTIRNKIDTETAITSALKSASNLADLITRLTYDKILADPYKKAPTGTITFTAGSGTCELDLGTMKISCGGKAVKSEDFYTLKEMILSDTNAKTVRAKYNGDDYFNASVSDPANFATVPTTLAIENPYKHSAVDIDLTTRLSWDNALSEGRTPAGTIIYTSGSATCALDLASLKFSECSGSAAIDGDGVYQITGMAMKGTPTDHIYAEYKGDSFFDSSVSASEKFKSVPTDLSLSDAKKSSDGLIGMTVKLSWVEMTSAGTKPKGTISFADPKTGNTVCTLNISQNPPRFEDGCKGTVAVTREDKDVSFVITNLNTNGKAGDEIKAEYSGDDYFLASESNTINFNKVETSLEITDAARNGTEYADVSALLGWDETKANGAKPTGTVKFTAGSGSCTLNIATKDLDCDPKVGTVSDDRSTISIVKMLLADSKADRVKAEYSGDAVFNPSSSKTVLFRTVQTKLSIGTAFKPDPGHANVLDLRLNWNTEKTYGRTPEGTITLQIGSGTCLLDAATGELGGCTGTAGAPTLVTNGSDVYYKYAIRNMTLSDSAATTIKASYEGDGFFEASATNAVTFSKVPTGIELTKAYKPGADLADVDAILSWDPDGTEGLKPTGTIKLTIRNGANGAGDVVTGTCTLDLSTKKLNCDSDPAIPEITPADGSITSVIRNMLLADKNADRIKAEYSGDTLFEASESTVKLFTSKNKIDTELEIMKAIKPDALHADVDARLSWEAPKEDVSGSKPTPTGTIKYTVGSGSCTLDIESKKLTCEPKSGTVNSGSGPGDDSRFMDFSILQMLLDDKTADRVKAEYSGDANFNPSSSTLLFEKIDTEIKISKDIISDSYHSPYKHDVTFADLITTLTRSESGEITWNEMGCDDTKCPAPTGTIKLTVRDGSQAPLSGDTVTGTCTLDIKTLKLDCEGNVTKVDNSYKVINLLLADKSADRIRAEYSGDGFYNGSTSTIVLFDTHEKKNTELEISNGVKNSDNSIDLDVKLTIKNTPPDGGTPTGTITFTSGYATCILDISDPDNIKFDKCSGNPNPGTDGTYKITNMVMNGTPGNLIYAVYGGDALYNSSTSNMIPFQTVPTRLDIMAFKTQDGEHADIYGLISWDDNDNTMQVQPKGTVKFTVGSGSCTLNLETEAVSCDMYSTDVEDWYPGMDYLGFYVEDLFLADKNADMISAEYSGDGYFGPSANSNIKIIKNNVVLKITKITDEQGKEHSWYSPEEKVIVHVKLYNDYPNIQPTGQVTLTGSGITCSPINYEETQQFECTLPKLTEDFTVKASYAGDNFYTPHATEETIPVRPKLDPTLKITKVTDTNSIVQEEYFKEENVFVFVELTDYDEAEPPTGKITASGDGVTCSPIQYEEKQYLKCRLPSTSGEKEITAEYAGDTYYNSTSAESSITVAEGHDITLEVELWNYQEIPQPYFVYDPQLTGDQQLVYAIVTFRDRYLDNYPTGVVNITDGVHTCSISPVLPSNNRCSFNVQKTGETTVKAFYSGDGIYRKKTAETPLVIKNRIETNQIIQSVFRQSNDPEMVEMFLDFQYEKSDVVGPEIDKSYSPANHGEIKFTFTHKYTDQHEHTVENDVVCIFNLNSKTISADVNQSSQHSQQLCDSGSFEFEEPDESNPYYHFKNIWTFFDDHDDTNAECTVKAEYNGNRYYYPSEIGPREFGKEEDGETTLVINKAVRLETYYAFLTAEMTYDTAVEGKYPGMYPTGGIGKLTLTPVGGSSPTCTWDFGTNQPSSNCQTLKVGAEKTSAGVIEFEISGMPIAEGVNKVSVRYDSDRYYSWDETQEELEIENFPEIKIRYAIKPGGNTGEVVFEVTDIGPMADKYNVFDQLRATVSENDTSWQNQKFVFSFPNGGSSQCSGTVSETADGYKLEGWSVSYPPDYFSNAEYLQLELRSSRYPLVNNDSPVDQKQYGLETNLTLEDLLKAGSVYFLESYLTYDSGTLSGLKPTGKIRYTFLREDGTVYPTQESVFEYNLASSDENPIKNLLDGLYVGWGPVKVYAEYLGDAYFKPCRSATREFVKETEPSVSILNAIRIKQEGNNRNHVYAAFTVSNMGTLWQKYHVINEIAFKSNGSTVGQTRFTYPGLDPVTGSSESLAQNGDGIYILEDAVFEGLMYNDDTYLQIHLYSPYRFVDSVLYSIKKYEGSGTEVAPISTYCFKIKSKYAFLKTEFHIMDPQVARQYYGKEPTGTITFKAGDSTCIYTFPDVFSDADHGTFSGCAGDIHTYGGRHFSLRVTDWQVPSNAGEATITYSGNGFYAGHSANVSLPDRTPSITINSAVGTGNNTGNLKFTVNNYYGTGLESSYGMYTGVYMEFSDSGGSSASTLIINKQLDSSSFDGSLSVSGGTFTITGLHPTWTDTSMKNFLLRLIVDDGFPGLNTTDATIMTNGQFSSWRRSLLGSPVSFTLDIDPVGSGE